MKKVPFHKNNKRLFFLSTLVFALVFTLVVISQPQRFIQFAMETLNAPPMFGCLRVGPGDKNNCASRMGQILSPNPLMLHDRPLKNQTVYYGDRVSGSASFSNVGDLPIQVNSFSLVALSKQKQYFVAFAPRVENKTVNPQESISLTNASYRFQAKDPIGQWDATYFIVDNNNQAIPVGDQSTSFTVNSTCTALRIKELTEKDKINIKDLCNKNPNSKLCNSRQYCEIFQGQGPNCSKPNASTEKPMQQCDQWIVPAKAEQDILEELCKIHPDTDACINFCKRSLQSPICPKNMIWVDKKTGKEAVPQPKIIKEPQNLASGTYKNIFLKTRDVAGAKTKANGALLADAMVAQPGCNLDCMRGYTSPPPAPPPAPAPATPASTPPSNPCGARPAPCGNPAQPAPAPVVPARAPQPAPPACEPNLPAGCCHAADCQLGLEVRASGNAGPIAPDGTICAAGAQIVNGTCTPRQPGVCGPGAAGLQYCTSPQDVVPPDPGASSSLTDINNRIPQPIRVVIGTDPECNDSFGCTLLTSLGENATTYAATGAVAGCGITAEVGCLPGAIGGGGIGLVSGTIVGLVKGVGKYYLHETLNN